jgi:hypothetical protein
MRAPSRLTISNLAVAAGLLLPLAAGDARAQQSPAGLQMTPDSRRYLISKDVGNERWAISFDLESRTVTGNVFKTDGSPPSFIWCRITDETPAADPAANAYLLDCYGAGACAAAPCSSAAWTPIATGVPLSGDFLLPDGTKATFRGHVQPIFTQRCALAGCHSGAEPQEELNLEEGQAYGNVFLVLAHHDHDDGHFLIEPFDPSSSHLYLKILGLEEGDRMPPGGPYLREEQTDLIRDWILEGAADN